MACVAANWSDREKPEISSSTEMRNMGIGGMKSAHMPMVAADDVDPERWEKVARPRL
jgi:hypothetical protein